MCSPVQRQRTPFRPFSDHIDVYGEVSSNGKSSSSGKHHTFQRGLDPCEVLRLHGPLWSIRRKETGESLKTLFYIWKMFAILFEIHRGMGQILCRFQDLLIHAFSHHLGSILLSHENESLFISPFYLNCYIYQ